MRASIGGSLEMVMSTGGEEIGVEEKHGVVEQRLACNRGLIERLQERVPYMRSKGLDLKRVCRVFVRRVASRGPLQVLVHYSMDDLVNNEAPVEIKRR